MSKHLPSQEELRELLDYDPETGLLTWKERPIALCTSPRAQKIFNTRFAGRRAAAPNTQGYQQVMIRGRNYRAHRVIWKMMTGEEPNEVDHINGQRSDNRWANLRDVDARTNHRNMCRSQANTSGVTGVGWMPDQSRWRAYIGFKHLGSFDCVGQAIRTRKSAEKSEGYHPNHGRS